MAAKAAMQGVHRMPERGDRVKFMLARRDRKSTGKKLLAAKDYCKLYNWHVIVRLEHDHHVHDFETCSLT